ncbi:hypothetical protein MASR2M64_10120 [Candidatus Cloacimonadota bacterium]
MLSELAKQKPEWYILYECALAAYRLQKYDESFACAIRAASAFGKLEVKIHLWELMKDLFASQKRFDDSIAMLKLQAAIRFQMHWSISNTMLQELSSYHVRPESLADFKRLFQELCASIPELNKTHANFQQTKQNPASPSQKIKLSPAELELKQGTISKILTTGSSGFIASDLGNYYFRFTDCTIPLQEICCGLKVSFTLVDSFDAKKQSASLRAVNIKKA